MAVSTRASEQRALARLAELEPAVRARPRRGPSPADAPRPELRLVETAESPSARRRRLAAIAVVGAAALLAVLLAVAVAQAVVVQRQARLDHLDQQLAEETARYERLRLEVARLEAPERVVTAAQQRLGMVLPEEVTYVTPPPGTRTGGAGPGEADSPTATWGRLKPDLAPRP